jgi:hexokinase
MAIFEDKELQGRFDKAVVMYDKFREVVARRVNFNEPAEVLNQLSELNNVSYIGAECEAMFEFLNDRHAMKKLSVLDMESRGAAEKKIILAAEIGGTNFYLTLVRLMVKESHYQSDRLRTALSYLKSEMQNIQ